MSKSLGNVLDPRDLTVKYGTDALRMSLIVANGPGNDLRLGEDKVKAYKLFANKIWNATRFVLEKAEDLSPTTLENNVNIKENIKSIISFLNKDDKELLENWYQIKKDIVDDIENYRLHIASEKIYDYFWKTFCDVIIETHKIRIQNTSDLKEEATKDQIEDKKSAQILLRILLREQIIILHPFMPFITEALWDKVRFTNDSNILMIQQI